ncbi:MAG: hypothetical protein IJ454_03085 [Clostridia bacterium]|nr:hypothetical protein [Clostridia bacterium]
MIYSQIENPKCNLCVHADENKASGNILCDIKGTVPADYCCKKFKYDIFKKKIKPRQALSQKSYTKEDFSV